MIRNQDTKFTKLFVGGIPYESGDDALRKFFAQFGEIREAVVIKDRVTKKSKGYGFVTMATSDAAELACKNKRPMIEGRQANVNLAYLGAKPKPTRAMRSPPSSPYAYCPAVTVGSPAQQYLYTPMYSPTQSAPTLSGSPLTVIPPGPQSPNGVAPQVQTIQPFYIDYGGGTAVVFNAVYDPYCYSPQPTYVQTLPQSPPPTNSPVTPTFTFPGPVNPTVPTQHFFPAQYEFIAQPQVQ